MAGADRRIGSMEGAAALPRSNGELVFQAPWEGRAFGLAVSLYDSGRYPWSDFSGRLVTEIAADAKGSPERYYEHWLAAFERLMLDQGVLSRDELDARTAEYESGQRDDD
ncbi:MAG: nitrile hydratase accessory protein [Chloroflexota bacterium]